MQLRDGVRRAVLTSPARFSCVPQRHEQRAAHTPGDSGVPRDARPALRVTLIEHPRQASWEHMNDVANAPLSASLMTGYAAAVLEAAGHERHGRGGAPRRPRRPRRSSPGRRRASSDLVGVHLVYDWSDGRHVAGLLADVRSGARARADRALRLLPHLCLGRPARRLPEVTAVIVGELEADHRRGGGGACRDGGGAVADGSAMRASWPPCPASPCAATTGRPRLTPARPLIADLDGLPFPRRTPEMARAARDQHRRQPWLLRCLHASAPSTPSTAAARRGGRARRRASPPRSRRRCPSSRPSAASTSSTPTSSARAREAASGRSPWRA